MKYDLRPMFYALLGFLAAWQGSDFALDYRAVLGAVVAAGLAGSNPKATKRK